MPFLETTLARLPVQLCRKDTISSYRDTFRLFLEFSGRLLKKAPSILTFDEIDAPLIGAFLQDLEKTRRISARTRNLRLTAVRSFFRYAAFELPDHAGQIQRAWQFPENGLYAVR
jgi:site-specific recombinase XerD